MKAAFITHFTTTIVPQLFARTYTRVNLHATSIPLTDGEAREMGVERYVYALRCRDLEATSLSAVQRDEAPPITSFFETGVILFPTLVCSRALVTKVRRPFYFFLLPDAELQRSVNLITSAF